MRRFIIYLVAVILYFCIAQGVKAESISVKVDVTDPLQEKVEAGSPSVLAASDSASGIGGYELDIKNAQIGDSLQGEIIPAQLTLTNTSEEDKQIDRVELIVTRLDGTTELSESIKTNEALQPAKETTLDYSFPGGLDPGKYIGTVEVYSQDTLLGRTKTMLNVLPKTSEVLGVSTANFDYIPPIIAAIFAGVSILGFVILLKKRSLLQSKSLSLFDVIGIAVAVSAIGFGLFIGYTLVQLLF